MLTLAVCMRRNALATLPYDDIRKIVIAKTIVESGSMQKAALELKVTPSAVSQSLSSLEKKIGAALFVRDQGRLIPTETCLNLIRRAEPALAALHTLFEDQKEPLKIDYLDLGAYESLAHTVLSDFANELRQFHPKVRFNIIVNRTSELLKKLRSGEICTALIAETDGMDRLRLEEVGRDEMGLFVATKHLEKIGEWSEVEQMGFGTISTSTDGVPSYLKKFLKQCGSKNLVSMTSDSYEVLRRAAVNGLCASVLPMRVAQRSKNSLIEVTQFQGSPKVETGEHRIYLASMDRCDEAESDFLAGIARRCLQKGADGTNE